MEGRFPEGHVRDPSNTRMVETSRKQRIMDVSSEGGPGPRRGCSAIDGRMDATDCNITFKCTYNCVHCLVT